MEPRLPLSTFSRATITLDTPLSATPSLEIEQNQPFIKQSPRFPSTGFGPDDLLNLATVIIDSDGRVIDMNFDLNELREEILAVGSTLSKTYEDSGIQPKIPLHPFIDVDFLTCLFELRELLDEDTPPEMIGGAVLHSLGENFYISYVMKRFKLTHEEAKRILAYFLTIIKKLPADIDCRQYVKREKFLELITNPPPGIDCPRYIINDKNQSVLNRPLFFKLHLSQMLSKISKTVDGQTVDGQTIKDQYFQKLFLVSEKEKKFGMGRFGQFLGKRPLEYMIMVREWTDRFFITYNKSLSLEIHPPVNAQAKPTVSLKFNTKASEPPYFVHETCLFQQVAMISDAADLTGVDWRGFFSLMAEATLGISRTVNPTLLHKLWDIFAESKLDLMEKTAWAANNHILNRGEESQESEKELLASFYWNIFLFLIDKNLITGMMTEQFLEKHCESSEHLNFLHQFLKIPYMNLATKLAWFKLGMWIKMGYGVPRRSLSTHYGTISHRIVCPISNSVVWIPVDLPNSCRLVLESIKTGEWHSLLHFIQPVSGTRDYSLSGFNKWIDATETKALAEVLRVERNNAQALLLAFRIDSTRVTAGIETKLPNEWLKLLPTLLTAYPEIYDEIHTLILGNQQPDAVIAMPALEKIQSPIEWISYLLSVQDKVQRKIGFELFKELSHEERLTVARKVIPKLQDRLEDQIVLFNALDEASQKTMAQELEQLILAIINKKLNLNAPTEYYSWLLLLVSLGDNKNCHLASDKKIVLNFTLDVRKFSLPIAQREIVTEGIALFKDPTKETTCIQLFDQLFPDYQLDLKPFFTNHALVAFAQELLKKPDPHYSVGLKIYLILMNQSISMAMALLKEYPQLHSKAPGAGKNLARVISTNKPDSGSLVLKALLIKKDPINHFKWIAALLCHQKKEIQQLGVHLTENLSEEEQRNVWNSLYPKLIKNRPTYIPEAIRLFKLLKITPATSSEFFISWIEQIRKLKNKNHYTSFQNFIKSTFPELANHKKLQVLQKDVIHWVHQLEKLIAEPEIVKPVIKKITAENCIDHMTTLLTEFSKSVDAKESGLPQKAKKIEEEIATLTEKYGKEIPLEKFRVFYRFYYSNRAYIVYKQQEPNYTKPKAGLKTGGYVLLQIINTIELPKKKELLFYLKDLTIIFSGLFDSNLKCSQLTKEQLIIFFGFFVDRLSFGFKTSGVARSLLNILVNQPSFANNQKSLNCLLKIALVLNYRIENYMRSDEEMMILARYLRHYVSSPDLLKVNTVLKWIANIMEQLSEKNEDDKLHRLFSALFLAPDSPSAFELPVETWMLEEGFSTWTIEAFLYLQKTEDAATQIFIMKNINRYLGMYESLEQLSPKRRADAYLQYITVLVELKRYNYFELNYTAFKDDYTRITEDFLDKIITFIYPLRSQIRKEALIENLATLAFLCIQLRRYRVYFNDAELFDSERQTAERHINFCTRLGDAMIKENDLVFLQEFGKAYLEVHERIEKQEHAEFGHEKPKAIIQKMKIESFAQIKAVFATKMAQLIAPKAVSKPQSRSDMLREASKNAKELDPQQFYDYFINLEPNPQDLPLYRKLVVTNLVPTTLLQKIKLYLKYHHFSQDDWESIIFEIIRKKDGLNREIIDFISDFFSSEKNYGKELWSSEDPLVRDLWFRLVVNVVSKFCPYSPEPYLSIAEQIFPIQPENNPLESKANQERCTALFTIRAVAFLKLDHSNPNITLTELNKFFSEVGSYSVEQLIEFAPTMMYYIWTCAMTYPNLNAKGQIIQILGKNEGFRRFCVLRILKLLCETKLTKRIDSLFSGLTLFIDDESYKEDVSESFAHLLTGSEQICHVGPLELSSLQDDFLEIFAKLKIGEFVKGDSNELDLYKCSIFQLLLDAMSNPKDLVLKLLASAIPPQAWLEYILKLIRTMPKDDSQKTLLNSVVNLKGLPTIPAALEQLRILITKNIKLIFISFYSNIPNTILMNFFVKFYTESKMQFLANILTSNTDFIFPTKEPYDSRHHALLSALGNITLPNDAAKLAFIKDLFFAIESLMKVNRVSQEEVATHFKKFAGFVTQKFKKKDIAWSILQLLFKLNTSLPSLLSVNLCIKTPLKDFVNTEQKWIELSALIYRYIHSIDSMTVDTGFLWLSSVIETAQPAQRDRVLALIFDPKHRYITMQKDPGYEKISWEVTNKNEIVLEQWMFEGGISKFFLFLWKVINEVKSPKAIANIKALLLRCIDVYQRFETVTIDGHYQFCMVISEAKRRDIFKTPPFQPEVGYETMIFPLLDRNISLVFSHVEKRDILESALALVSFGSMLIDRVETSLERCHEIYIEYFKKIVSMAEKQNNLVFLQTLAVCLRSAEETGSRVIPIKLPYQKVESLIKKSLLSFKGK